MALAHVGVDAAQQPLRMDVVAESLDPVRELGWVRLRHAVAVAVPGLGE